jgi:hypothetical protein
MWRKIGNPPQNLAAAADARTALLLCCCYVYPPLINKHLHPECRGLKVRGGDTR